MQDGAWNETEQRLRLVNPVRERIREFLEGCKEDAELEERRVETNGLLAEYSDSHNVTQMVIEQVMLMSGRRGTGEEDDKVDRLMLGNVSWEGQRRMELMQEYSEAKAHGSRRDVRNVVKAIGGGRHEDLEEVEKWLNPPEGTKAMDLLGEWAMPLLPGEEVEDMFGEGPEERRAM